MIAAVVAVDKVDVLARASNGDAKTRGGLGAERERDDYLQLGDEPGQSGINLVTALGSWQGH